MINYRHALRPWLVLAAAVGACESSSTDPSDAAAGASSDDGYGGATPKGGTSGAGAPNGGKSSGASGRGGAAPDANGGSQSPNGGEPNSAAGSSDAPSGGTGAGGTGAGGTGAGGTGAGGTGAGGTAGAGVGGTSVAGTNQGGQAGALDGEAGSPGDGAREFAYVSLILGGVLPCSLDLNSGETKLLSGSPINRTGSAANIAVDKSQKFVYVADEHQHIDTYRIAADGTLPARANSSVTTGADLIALTLDPKGRFAYAGSSQGHEIYAFAIDATSGTLTAVGQALKVGLGPTFSNPAFLAADPTGNFVYLSLQTEIGLHGYRIDQTTGALNELAGSPFATTGMPEGDTLFGGGIVFDPSGAFMYTSGGALNAFSIESASGKPTLLAGSPFTLDEQSDKQAPNLAIDPQGKYLYTTSFLLTDHISGFRVLASGALEPVPNMPIKGNSPYSIAVDRTGRFAFVGIDGPTLAVYRIARSSGFLTPVAGSEFQFGGLEPKIVFASAQ